MVDSRQTRTMLSGSNMEHRIDRVVLQHRCSYLCGLIYVGKIDDKIDDKIDTVGADNECTY